MIPRPIHPLDLALLRFGRWLEPRVEPALLASAVFIFIYMAGQFVVAAIAWAVIALERRLASNEDKAEA